jgi:streptogramin lyase
MIELLRQADPAAGVEIDRAHLRDQVEAKIGRSPDLAPVHRSFPLAAAVAAFATVAAVAVAATFFFNPPRERGPINLPFGFKQLGDLPGIDQVIPLEMGGVKTMAVDGDTLWVLESLQGKLSRFDARSGQVEASYQIDGYAEGIVVGDGYLWLLGYDNDGEVLRFDPVAGEVDLRIPLGGAPTGGAAWFDESLWISNDQGQLHQIAPSGEKVATTAGELKGQGLGYLWVNDPETGLISSLAADGTRGEIVIPTRSGVDTADGWGVRRLVEASGKLWLMDDDYPWGTNLSVFDPATGELRSFASITFGLHGMVEFDGALWITSHTDHLLIRVDPITAEVTRYPMPGKAGGLAVADGSLWVVLHHPGALLRLDTAGGLLEQAPIAVDDWDRFPHRLLCTGPLEEGRPTVILEPAPWIDYGSWSVIQAQLSGAGYLVCANGYLQGGAAPAERAAALEEALSEAGIAGPFVLVANGDGVSAARLFAEGRSDIAGVVLVDPIPVGFTAFLESQTGDPGHPPWAELDPEVAAGLDGFGDTPMVVIGQDPETTFLNPRFIEAFGLEKAEAISSYWQQGLDFYAGLSTRTRRAVADGTGMHMILWDRPNLVVEETLGVLEQASSGAPLDDPEPP